MNQRKNSLKFFLVFVFALLSLKSLLPYGQNLPGSCDELGHLHLVVLSQKALKDSATDDSNSQTCHSGKSMTFYPAFPDESLNFLQADFDVVHELIFTVKSHFKTPYLEPHKKPPRLA